ncbi:proline iminopeptidase [Halobacillus karajensis]|uniref:alpha/beta fold hydrolase n=1 Tax=Halobacillus karajensis TaxID=195088 RepID=UPI0008A7CE49|nr:alpha/beta hydrolase [Halobacillus karajensis]SEH63636.1 proline iminopeptidase [Halobacillus karajensis]
MTWKKRMVHSDRGNFEIFEKGEGFPLAVTHIYSEFNETGDYFAEVFVKTHHVYIINLKDCGNSDKAKAPHEFSMLETILDLESIRRALGFTKWKFAGHSTGGMLGVLYGIYFSDSLEKLLLVSAAAREYMTFSPDCIYNESHPNFNKMQELIERLKNNELSAQKRSELSKERTKLSLLKPEDYDQYFNRFTKKKMSVVRMNFFARELHTFDVTKKLPRIKTPTLIIGGTHDIQCPPLYSREMAEWIPDSILFLFNESNHYPHLEEPTEFNKVIVDYFD